MSAQATATSFPEYMKNIHNPPSSDPFGLDGEGKGIKDFRGIGTGSNVRARPDPKKPVKMKLTQEEQDIVDGKQGEVKAKVLKTIIQHGQLFGADRLVDLAGAPHTSFFTAPSYMEAMLNIFQKCADAGLKSYAPYTINPRPWDLVAASNVGSRRRVDQLLS